MFIDTLLNTVFYVSIMIFSNDTFISRINYYLFSSTSVIVISLLGARQYLLSKREEYLKPQQTP